MAWTYDPSLSSPKDQVRFYVGDTDSAAPLMQDGEIAFLLTQSADSPMAAAAAACWALAMKYARQVDTTNLSLSISASQRSAAFRELAKDLEARAGAAAGAFMFVGGLSVAGNDALDADTNATQPNFKLGQDDFPGNG